MDQIFGNLKLLKQDMIDHHWIIDSFYFDYNGKKYIVLVKLINRETGTSQKQIPKYALVKLEFLYVNDVSKSLSAFANVNKIMWDDIVAFRKFFNIQFNPNLGDILKQFNQHFARFIPPHVSVKKSKPEKLAMVYGLDGGNSKDPLKIYCYGVKRNSEGMERSDFNDNKTKLLRKSLYDKLSSDKSLSFNYSTDPSDEKSDEEILYNWSKNKE